MKAGLYRDYSKLTGYEDVLRPKIETHVLERYACIAVVKPQHHNKDEKSIYLKKATFKTKQLFISILIGAVVLSTMTVFGFFSLMEEEDKKTVVAVSIGLIALAAFCLFLFRSAYLYFLNIRNLQSQAHHIRLDRDNVFMHSALIENMRRNEKLLNENAFVKFSNKEIVSISLYPVITPLTGRTSNPALIKIETKDSVVHIGRYYFHDDEEMDFIESLVNFSKTQASVYKTLSDDEVARLSS